MNRSAWALLGLGALIVVALIIATFAQGGRATPTGSRASTAAVNAGVDASALPATDPGLIAPGARALAPELQASGWLNSPPTSLAALRGRVVLVDFWTYSCINCIRTIPHLRSLHDAYGEAGLTIVGVHSPEFDFEKNPANVTAAVQRLGVTWPVALDPQMATWNAWQNRYWPAQYLVDRQGRIALVHFGEGDEARLNSAVVSLLGSSPSASLPGAAAAPTQAEQAAQTPELYAASDRGRVMGGYPERDGSQDYPDLIPQPQQKGLIFLAGRWSDHGDRVTSLTVGHVRLRFHAANVYFVGESTDGAPRTVDVAIDGHETLMIDVASSRLYTAAELGAPGDHLVDLIVPAGFSLYSFTFG